MGKTNWKRVFLGGVVAGVVLNIFRFGIVDAIRGTFEFGAVQSASYFISGMLIIWLYSAIRPRYGSGPKTAIIAGTAFFVLSGLQPAISHVSIGLDLSIMVVIKGIIFLAMYVAATLAGAWVYKEQE